MTLRLWGLGGLPGLIFIDFHGFGGLGVEGFGGWQMKISLALLGNLGSEVWKASQFSFYGLEANEDFAGPTVTLRF